MLAGVEKNGDATARIRKKGEAMSQPANLYGAPTAAVTEEVVETQPVEVFAISGRIGQARYVLQPRVGPGGVQ